MIIAGSFGDNEAPTRTVEVIDLLSDGTQKCITDVPNYPHSLGASGGFINGRAVLCGGTNFPLVRKEIRNIV